MHAGRVLCFGVCPGLCLIASLARAAPGSLELSAGAGYTRLYDGRRELGALVTLSLPLDRAARPRLVLSEPTRRDKTNDDPPPAAPASASAPLVLSPALAHATLRAAFRAAGRASALARLGGLATRARASAVLPELRLRAARTIDDSLRLAPTSQDPYRYTRAGAVSVTLEGRATWRLDRLVFADEELRIERLRAQRARADAKLAEDVLRALFAWQRALVAVERADSDPEGPEAAELRLLEAEVRLDVLTGGWFSETVLNKAQMPLSKRRRSEQVSARH
jgi:hypothetical protein